MERNTHRVLSRCPYNAINMKRFFSMFLSVLLCLLGFAGCNQSQNVEKITYEQITAAKAKTLMDSETNYIILDVRTEEEFNKSHIEGAILIPDYEIGEMAESILKDKNQLILVYCRSGRRSKNASSELATMGYTNIKEFGGIIDWPYETVTK